MESIGAQDSSSSPSSGSASTEIIERQVVVMHRRFCKELTPLDLSDGKSCGARLK